MCGSGAHCSNTRGSYSCSCPPGYSGNAEKSCVDIDECKRPNTCGVGATCTNTPGNYECSCPSGTIPDPDPKTKCTEVIKCNGNDDCPGNSFCDPEGHQCLCPEPNIGGDCRRKCLYTVLHLHTYYYYYYHLFGALCNSVNCFFKTP